MVGHDDAVGHELHAGKRCGAPDEFRKPRAFVRVKEERAMGHAADQVIAPVVKVCPAFPHCGHYIINCAYCGNLLWHSSLTLLPP